MGIKSWLGSVFGRGDDAAPSPGGMWAERPSGELVPLALPAKGTRAVGSPSAGGVGDFAEAGGEQRPRRGAAESLNAYNTNPTMRSAFGGLAAVVAAVHWRLYIGPPDERGSPGSLAHGLRTAPQAKRHAMLREDVAAGEVREVTRHPWIDLIERPNRFQSGRLARSLLVTSYKMIGESAMVLNGDEGEAPTEWYAIPGTWISHRPQRSEPYWTIDLPGGNGQQLVTPIDRVIPFVDPNPANPFGRGIGVGQVLADEGDIDEHAAKMLVAFFANNAMPANVVSVKGLSRPAAERMKRDFNNRFQGFKRAYQTLFTGADIDVKRLDVAFRDMQLAQLRIQQRDAIQQGSGRPPEKMGIVTNSNKASALAASLIDATDQQVPMLEVLAEGFRRLAWMFDERLWPDYDDPVPVDVESQRDLIKTLPSHFRVNDVCRAAQVEPWSDEDGGNGLIVNGQWYARPRDVAAPAVPAFGSPQPEPDEPEGIDVAEGEDEESGNPAGEAQWRAAKQSDVKLILDAVTIDDMAKHVAPVVVDVAATFGQDTLDELEAGEEFDDESAGVKRMLRRLRKERIGKLINTTTRAALSDALREVGVREWLRAKDAPSEQSIIEAVIDVFARARSERVDPIATSESVRAAAWGTNEALKQTSVTVRKEWIATMDDSTRDSHMALDGQQREPDEPFEIPPGHDHSGRRADGPGGFGIAAEDINCLMPDSLIEGSFFAAMRSSFRGSVVECVTSGGRRLRVTANHPVMTARGAVAAKDLRKGDDLIRYRSNVERRSDAATPADHVDDGPARAADAFSSMDDLFGSCSIRKRAIDLHGEAAFVDGDIHVVTTDSALKNRLRAARRDGDTQLGGAATDPGHRHLSGNGALPVLGGTDDSPLGSAPRTAALSIYGGAIGDDGRPLDLLRFGSTPDLDAVAHKGAAKGASVDAAFVGYLLDALAGSVARDQIVDVVQYEWCGHVFDFSSVSGLMVADGFVVGNCRCGVGAVVIDGEGKAAPAHDRTEEQRRSLSRVLDDKVRAWEKEMAAAARAGFDAQEAAVIARIRELF